MLKIKKKLNRRSLFLILPILFLGTVLSLLIVDRSQNYLYYERIEFECADTKIHANLYHPSKDLDFQEKHPLVIFVHGFSSQKDFGLRIPIELTKRGFYVACVDMPGHGESRNSHLLAVDEYENLEMTQLCSKLLNKIENLGYYRQINKKQIGLVGHSLGGYVVLMNGLYDDRFKVTISWDGVTDIMRPFKGADISDKEKELLHDNNPEEIMNNNTKQPNNLLLITHWSSPFYKDNKKLHYITECKWKVLKYPVNNEQEAHLLNHPDTMIITIERFEKEFFGSKYKNGLIQLSYNYTYILLILTFIGIILTTFSLMIYCSKFILKRGDLAIFDKNRESIHACSSLGLSKKNQIIILFLSITIFLIAWIISSFIFGVLAFTIAPFIILAVYFFILKKKLFKDKERAGEKLSFNDKFKSEFSYKSIEYAILCSGIFLSLYFAFSLLYPFFLFYPHSFLALALTIIIFPLLLSTEIFYRKMIYPSLDFIKSRKKRTYVITLITFFIQLYIMFQTLRFLAWPVVMAYTIAFMISSMMNGIIYHKTERLGACLVNSFIILGIFYGATISFIINLILIIN